MKFLVTKTSDYDYVERRDFNSLQELVDFCIENSEVIIGAPPSEPYWKCRRERGQGEVDFVAILEIYDGYRE